MVAEEVVLVEEHRRRESDQMDARILKIQKANAKLAMQLAWKPFFCFFSFFLAGAVIMAFVYSLMHVTADYLIYERPRRQLTEALEHFGNRRS